MDIEEVFEVVRMLGLDMKVSSDKGTESQECEHKYVIQNDDGWYVCQACGEELRYDSNKPPIKIADLYREKALTAKMKSRTKNLFKWLDKYNILFDDTLMVDFLSFINKYVELYPDRQNLINKDYILYHMLRKRGYDIHILRLPVKLPKLKKTMIQNEEICRTIFKALNWSFSPISE